MDIPRFIVLLSPITALIAFVTGVRLYRFQSREMKLLVLYIGLALATEILLAVVGRQSIDNNWVSHPYTIIEYGILTYVFSRWQRSDLLRRVLVWSIFLFVVVEIGAVLFYENIRQFDSTSRTVEGIVFIGVAAFTLYGISRDETTIPLRDPRFWIAMTVLFYFAGTTVIFAVFSALIKIPSDQTKVIWLLLLALNPISYLLYARSFVCSSPKAIS